MPTIAELLTDARTAYHRLMTGTSVVEVRDQNGETIRYQVANAAALLAYIQRLEQQLSGNRYGGPMQFIF